MKKLIALLLTLLIFSSCVLFCSAAVTVGYDVNSDGKVKAADARVILRIAAKIQ